MKTEQKYELNEEKLKNRLQSLIAIYDLCTDKDFPRSYVMLGFGTLFIRSKHELLCRIKELSEILRIDVGGLEK